MQGIRIDTVTLINSSVVQPSYLRKKPGAKMQTTPRVSRSWGCLPKGGGSSERDMKTTGEETVDNDRQLTQPIVTEKTAKREAALLVLQR